MIIYTNVKIRYENRMGIRTAMNIAKKSKIGIFLVSNRIAVHKLFENDFG